MSHVLVECFGLEQRKQQHLSTIKSCIIIKKSKLQKVEKFPTISPIAAPIMIGWFDCLVDSTLSSTKLDSRRNGERKGLLYILSTYFPRGEIKGGYNSTRPGVTRVTVQNIPSFSQILFEKFMKSPLVCIHDYFTKSHISQWNQQNWPKYCQNPT